MALKIRGVTVQIGGDVSGLSKALGTVNKEISATQSLLKDVNRLLKLDPKNTELLAQKQRLLSQAISQTKEKVQDLRQAQVEVNREFKKGNVPREAVDALKREIIASEQALKSLSVESSKILRDLGDDFKRAGETVSGFGQTLLPLTAGIAALGATAVKKAADFEQAMSEVKAISGATNRQVAALAEEAKRLGEKTKFSAREAAEGLKYMAMAGWDTEQMLDGLESIVKLAAAANEELGTVSDIVTDALTAFGLSAADSAHFADVLAQASSKSNTNVSMMGETFKYVAPVAGAMAYSVEDVAIAIGLLANAGVKGSQAGTNLRAILTRLVKPSEEGALALEELGVSVANTDGSIKPLKQTMEELRAAFQGLTDEEKAQMASSIAGQEAMSGLLNIVNASEADFNKLTTEIYNANGAVDKMSNTMQDNLNGRLTELGSAVEGVTINIGNMLIPMVEKAVTWLKEWTDKFLELSPEQQETALAIMGLVAVIGPLLIVIGKLITAFGAIFTAMASIKTAFGIFGNVLLPKVISSISTLTTAIGAKLVAAFTVLTQTVLPAVATAFSSVFAFIAANPIVLLIAAIAALVAAIAVYGDQIQEILQKVNDFLQSIFVRDWTEVFGPVLGNILNGFFANIKNLWDGIMQILNGFIDFIRGVFTGDWQRAWEGIVQIFGGIISNLVTVAKAPINGVISLINGMIGAINWVIEKINGISFDNPFTGETVGFDFSAIDKIPYLAKGGILSQGAAVVGEAGPELLTVSAGKAQVVPLTGAPGGSATTNNYGGGITIIVNTTGMDRAAAYDYGRILGEEAARAMRSKGVTVW